ncbi:hypothetical protein KI387_021227, partial [Taxus chinensis]
VTKVMGIFMNCSHCFTKYNPQLANLTNYIPTLCQNSSFETEYEHPLKHYEA